MHEHSQLLGLIKQYKRPRKKILSSATREKEMIPIYHNVKVNLYKSSFTHYQPGLFKFIYELFTSKHN